ncbi:DUF3291 domain-containing protein [Mucilaginibacter gilvus]|uniref:DUF3291 domain-containing protein n=1 Tax=Mucilaginibacter gilvus TaxID=2305909 RepID=A0A3S3UXP9_9SPHI|nr:DUF3291 domain-containing protein [Mucilaginibacter gilvus]RWY57123.1 DUF3291 domain-containing protein [Mucilaginibacter gilvus]
MANNLAQINIGKIKGADINDPVMIDFVNQLDEINSLAEHSKGFVWRLKGDYNNATDANAFDDVQIIINMSVWEKVDDLKDYVYNTKHRELLKNKRQWFEKLDRVFMVLWYIPQGHIPTIDEAKARLDYLQKHGPTPFAFDFKSMAIAGVESAANDEKTMGK